MLSCHLVTILTFMVRASSKLSSRFWSITPFFTQLGGVIPSCRLLLGGDSWFLYTALHSQCHSYICEHVRSWFHSPPVVVYKAIQHPSVSSVMMSRLVLNLRDPSLVNGGRAASFITSTAELTCPITTIIEPESASQVSEGASYVSRPSSFPTSSWLVSRSPIDRPRRRLTVGVQARFLLHSPHYPLEIPVIIVNESLARTPGPKQDPYLLRLQLLQCPLESPRNIAHLLQSGSPPSLTYVIVY